MVRLVRERGNPMGRHRASSTELGTEPPPLNATGGSNTNAIASSRRNGVVFWFSCVDIDGHRRGQTQGFSASNNMACIG